MYVFVCVCARARVCVYIIHILYIYTYVYASHILLSTCVCVCVCVCVCITYAGDVWAACKKAEYSIYVPYGRFHRRIFGLGFSYSLKCKKLSPATHSKWYDMSRDLWVTSAIYDTYEYVYNRQFFYIAIGNVSPAIHFQF